MPHRCITALTAALLVIAKSACAQCQYEFIPVSIPGSSSGSLTLRHIANNGWSGGHTGFISKPVLVSPDGIATLLAAPPGGGSVRAIGADGTVYGQMSPSGGAYQPCVWVNGVPQPLPTPIPATNGYVNDINDAGWIAGFIDASDSLIAGPCVWTPQGPLAAYEQVDGIAYGIDNSGTVSGWTVHPEEGTFRGYAWRDGRVTWLPLPEGMHESMVSGASLAGHVCGESWARLLTTSEATLWRNGTAMSLGVPPGYSRTRSHDVNSLGQVVGLCESMSGSPSPRALIWIDGTAHFAFTLLESPFVGSIGSLFGINDRGEICGSGYDAQGIACGVLLRPIRTAPGDVTIDCRVDERDLAALFEFWGSSYSYDGGPGDLDGDRLVGPSDLALVLGNWGGT
jgi:hypothetical protein